MIGKFILNATNNFTQSREIFKATALCKVSSLNVLFRSRHRSIHVTIRARNNNAGLPAGGNIQMTVREFLQKWRFVFERENISEPGDSVRNILAHVLNTRKLSDVDRLSNQHLILEEIQKLENLCKKRLKRMPVQYIIGEWNFRELNLKMRPPVFIPRPETEMLVDIVGPEIRSKKVLNVLELCCGSGAIGLALLNEFPDLRVTAVDRSREACQLTLENAQRLGLSGRLSLHQYEMNGEDPMDFVKGHVDLIVSNPPYVPAAAAAELQREITLYEDQHALNGGPDGLDIIRHILRLSSRLLHHSCKLFLEVDPSHPAKLVEILEQNIDLNLCYMKTHKDCYGKDRFVEIIKR